MIPTIAPEQLDAATTSGVVLLDFWQQTCPPCRALEPRLQAFARRHRHQLTAYRIDIDTDPQTPRRFAVMSIPTLIMLRDGREVARLDGLIREPDLEGALARASSRPRARCPQAPSPQSPSSASGQWLRGPIR